MQTRLLAIFAALFAAIALLVGCSKSDDSSKDLPDAATLLTESNQTTKAQTSVHLKLVVQGEIKELPIESLEGDLTNAPAVAAQGKANIQAPWLGLMGFFTVAFMLSLLIFIGEAVRDAFDPRKTFA